MKIDDTSITIVGFPHKVICDEEEKEDDGLYEDEGNVFQKLGGHRVKIQGATVSDGMQGGSMFIKNKFVGLYTFDDDANITGSFITEELVKWLDTFKASERVHILQDGFNAGLKDNTQAIS